MKFLAALLFLSLSLLTTAWAQPAHIVFDTSELSATDWAAFHRSPDGTQQQMTLQTTAGTHYRIESSTDLETWNTVLLIMGVQNGICTQSL